LISLIGSPPPKNQEDIFVFSSNALNGEAKDFTEKFCGVNVHRDLLVATILSDEIKETRRFVNDPDDMDKLRIWLKTQECKRVAMESTSIYWVPLYLALEQAGFEIMPANAHQVKGIPGRKTDQSDSEWLAHLLRGGQIKPSYVPEKRLRELRELTRLRVKYVQNRTAVKNRCQKVLKLCFCVFCRRSILDCKRLRRFSLFSYVGSLSFQ
jgi:transposase